MFGMSMTEIAVILGIALVVLGPERLPKLARTLGRWIRQVRSAATDVRHALEYEDIRRESREYMKRKDTPMSAYDNAAKEDEALADEFVPDDDEHGVGDLKESHPPETDMNTLAAEYNGILPTRQLTDEITGVFLDTPSPFEGFGVVIDREELPSVPVGYLHDVTGIAIGGGIFVGQLAELSDTPETDEGVAVELPEKAEVSV